ncbi:MAG TPA: NUDIX hydrolase, partial [Alphaproteobacteria bacterium]|nr:NUDIX hydrolase [Alphaproteobacteria bacterium]
EEACATIAIDALLAVYNIPRISQVQLIYRATLATPDFAAGPESLEVALFDWADIPWSDLAFPSVVWALREYDRRRGQTVFAPSGNPPGAENPPPL